MVIPCATSCMRTTLGCLISFIVEISRLICDSTTELVTHQQQKKKKKVNSGKSGNLICTTKMQRWGRRTHRDPLDMKYNQKQEMIIEEHDKVKCEVGVGQWPARPFCVWEASPCPRSWWQRGPRSRCSWRTWPWRTCPRRWSGLAHTCPHASSPWLYSSPACLIPLWKPQVRRVAPFPRAANLFHCPVWKFYSWDMEKMTTGSCIFSSE